MIARRHLAALAPLMALPAGRSRAAESELLSVGAFTIEAGTRRISSGSFPNLGGNPFARTTVAEYRVLYRGKPIVVGEGKSRVDRFWDVRALTGAPRPALLVATTGAWLVGEQAGALDVQTLVAPGSDLLHWQWLDAANGQPGPEQTVTIRDSRAEPRSIAEGRLLLIGRSTVLAIDTLRWWSVPVTAYETLRTLGGFHAGNVEVKALSPARTQVVYVGSRDSNAMTEYALVAFDFAAGTAYAVAFDSHALRFESVWDATPSWLAHYFEWTRDVRGAERIGLRQPVRSLPWQGRFEGERGDLEYVLHPAGAGLVEPLRKLIETEFGAARVAPTDGRPSDPDATSYDAAGRRFRLWHDPARRKLSVFAERIKGFTTEGTPALIERIGKRFNEILATGAHQSSFTTYPSHR